MNINFSQKSHGILLVSYYFPTRAHAGGLRILDLYSKIKEQCPELTIDLFSHERPTIDWKIDTAKNLFDNIFFSEHENLNFESFRRSGGGEQIYDVVDLQFHQCGAYVNEYKTISKKVLFTPMESLSKCFYLNVRPAELMRIKPKIALLLSQLKNAKEEISFARDADQVICVSEADAKFLRLVSRKKDIEGLETGISRIEFPQAFSNQFKMKSLDRRELIVLYIAYFGSQTNISALRWILDEVHPVIAAHVSGYKLQVVGRGDLSMFESDKSESLDLIGEVDSLEPYIRAAKLGIAPALSGSGFRGKINQYGIYGLPCVASNLAVKGLSYIDEVDIITAGTAKDFANGCIRLLKDHELNRTLGQQARKRCLENYTWQSKWPQIEKIYALNS